MTLVTRRATRLSLTLLLLLLLSPPRHPHPPRSLPAMMQQLLLPHLRVRPPRPKRLPLLSKPKPPQPLRHNA